LDVTGAGYQLYELGYVCIVGKHSLNVFGAVQHVVETAVLRPDALAKDFGIFRYNGGKLEAG
jgi:hypothetical protein